MKGIQKIKKTQERNTQEFWDIMKGKKKPLQVIGIDEGEEFQVNGKDHGDK